MSSRSPAKNLVTKTQRNYVQSLAPLLPRNKSFFEITLYTGLLKKLYTLSKIYYLVSKYHMDIKCARNCRITLNFLNCFTLESYMQFLHMRAPVLFMATLVFISF